MLQGSCRGPCCGAAGRRNTRHHRRIRLLRSPRHQIWCQNSFWLRRYHVSRSESYSCLGNLHLPAFSQWGASSLGDFSPTSASFDTALDAATHLHHGLLDRTLHAFTLSLCGILCPNYWSSRPCTRCRQARPPITRRYIV